jgi:hypothetical protein
MLSGLASFEWRPAYGTAAVYLGAVTGLALLLDWRLEQHQEEYLFESSHPSVSLGAAMAMLAVVALFGAMQTNAFIYFQF